MKKVILFIAALCACVSLFGFLSNIIAIKSVDSGSNETEISNVKNVVEEFGKRLKLVDLMSQEETLASVMTEQYGDLVARNLIASWIYNPASAPGRTVSSPWPERIDVISAEKASGNRYEIKGVIVELTSYDAEHGKITGERAITLYVGKVDENWKIKGVLLGDYKAAPLS